MWPDPELEVVYSFLSFPRWKECDQGDARSPWRHLEGCQLGEVDACQAAGMADRATKRLVGEELDHEGLTLDVHSRVL